MQQLTITNLQASHQADKWQLRSYVTLYHKSRKYTALEMLQHCEAVLRHGYLSVPNYTN